MEEHLKEVDRHIEDIKSIKIKNAIVVMNYVQSNREMRKNFSKNATLDQCKSLSDNLVRIEKDFSYLKNPKLLPKAYDSCLLEVSRRRKFRKTIDT